MGNDNDKPKTYRQEEKILSWLKDKKTITPMEALEQFACFRLSARIRRLRKAGHTIVTEQDHPHDHATYRLVSEDRHAGV